jgi:thiamine pyrophosphokinase
VLHAIVVADGETPDRAGLDATWPDWEEGFGLVVAADAGAVGAERLGLPIDLIVGDGDSLGEDGIARFREAGIELRLSPMEKDESDTELAVLACLERAPGRITVLGGFGGLRLDHTLANVSLLAMPELRGLDVRLLDSRTRVRLLQANEAPASLALPGRIGDLVSLLPFGEPAEGISTEGLAYSLRGEPLALGRVRGLSNVRSASGAAVHLERGRLLVLESPATL